MGREEIEQWIQERIDDPIKSTDDSEHDSHSVEVAIQQIICTECGSINGKEPRPVTVPDIKTECGPCGAVTVHEYVVPGEVDYGE